ncbi:MAG: TIGR03936 family radical SAM-associated protein [Chloroflexi bacterium]|nr:TIGR03936 family radical SAM-associated protein [Chloroflexota bacterium]
MQHSWERTLRRSHLPLVVSQGFHPQLRIQQACALPLGFTSRAEIVDVWLDTDCSIPDIEQALRKVVPPGIEIQSVEQVELNDPALQTRALASDYLATLLDHPDLAELQSRISGLLASPSISRTRRGKPYDLRQLVEDLRLVGTTPGAPLELSMRLSVREGATGRPEEVLDELGIPASSARVERINLIFSTD